MCRMVVGEVVGRSVCALRISTQIKLLDTQLTSLAFLTQTKEHPLVGKFPVCQIDATP